MALELMVDFKTVYANYWRIGKFIHDDIRDKATIEIFLYKDKEAADAGLKENALKREVITLNGIKENFADLRNTIKAVLYSTITKSQLGEDGEELNPWAEAEVVQ